MSNYMIMFLRMFVVICCLGVFVLFGQNTQASVEKELAGKRPADNIQTGTHFTVVFRFQRQTFQQDATPTEAGIVRTHLQYLKDLHAKGKVVYAGFRKDAVDGIVVFETATRDEARTLVENDPAVKERLFAWELHDFQTVLVRGVKP